MGSFERSQGGHFLDTSETLPRHFLEMDVHMSALKADASLDAAERAARVESVRGERKRSEREREVI